MTVRYSDEYFFLVPKFSNYENYIKTIYHIYIHYSPLSMITGELVIRDGSDMTWKDDAIRSNMQHSAAILDKTHML